MQPFQSNTFDHGGGIAFQDEHDEKLKEQAASAQQRKVFGVSKTSRHQERRQVKMVDDEGSDIVDDDEETVKFDVFKKFCTGLRSGKTSCYAATSKA